ncbi:hypothetical protein GGS24DRAFT_369522 [Hypoxylon argillaceum]|nr:hypothetical protein GGS24DRAFT_369522 [Hypoxylon argillaceum]
MKQKRVKIKPRVDYRRRWPTQQTLVESRVSIKPGRPKRHWKFGAGWPWWLKKKPALEPGKSTHPYDTGVGEEESSSESSSESTSALGDDDQSCLSMLTRMPHACSSRTPVPKFSHVKEEPTLDTPRPSIQLLRFLTTPKNSPFPRTRTDSPFDFDKRSVKSTRLREQTPAPPPKADRPDVKEPKTQSAKLKYLAKTIFRRRSLDRNRTACS